MGKINIFPEGALGLLQWICCSAVCVDTQHKDLREARITGSRASPLG